MKRKVKVTITGEYEIDTKYGGHIQLDSQLKNDVTLSEEQLIEEMKKELFQNSEDSDIYLLLDNMCNIKVKVD